MLQRAFTPAILARVVLTDGPGFLSLFDVPSSLGGSRDGTGLTDCYVHIVICMRICMEIRGVHFFCKNWNVSKFWKIYIFKKTTLRRRPHEICVSINLFFRMFAPVIRFHCNRPPHWSSEGTRTLNPLGWPIWGRNPTLPLWYLSKSLGFPGPW